MLGFILAHGGNDRYVLHARADKIAGEKKKEFEIHQSFD
jgi:hypothetical protein